MCFFLFFYPIQVDGNLGILSYYSRIECLGKHFIQMITGEPDAHPRTAHSLVNQAFMHFGFMEEDQ